METAGFCMIDWVMGNQTLWIPMVKGYLEAGRFSKKYFHKFSQISF
jgi:hypothetical protein